MYKLIFMEDALANIYYLLNQQSFSFELEIKITLIIDPDIHSDGIIDILAKSIKSES